MNDAWRAAISLAERVAAGEAETSAVEAAMRALWNSPDLWRGPTAGRDFAYLTGLCDALGRPDLSGELVTRLADALPGRGNSVVDGALTGQVAHAVASRGEPARASVLAHDLSAASAATTNLAEVRRAVTLAVLELRADDAVQATALAGVARVILRWAGGPEEDLLDVELSAVSVLAEAARRARRAKEAASLLDDLESLARRVVDLRGEDHPKSCSALVALASAEFGAAAAAADRDRMERALDVLDLAVQKTAAVLGARHPQALATLRAFAGAEHEAAALLGPEQRRVAARALVESTAARSETPRPPRPPRPSRPPARRRPGADTVRFSVLGPVGARRGEEVLRIGSPQQRALLAVLLLRDDHSATRQELIDRIWGGNPPQAAEKALATYAWRLRKSLGDGTLVHEAGGYALRIRDSDLDLTTARSLVSDAEAAVADGNAEGGRELYVAALAMFSGTPLLGVPGPFAERHRDQLSRWRQTLLERRLELDLATGRHDDAAEELAALTAADPRNDRLRELRVLAQHRSRTER
ncbi:AfsR/SARP family transcriptional regulator [Streptomyces sp. MAR4 CNY-716]